MDVVNLCAQLVRIPSESGREAAAAAFVAQAMDELGYDAVRIDDSGSVTGERRGAGPGPALLFDAHMDTVRPASPAQWSHDPWGGEVAEGRIWGLGAADVKGGLAAVLCGVAAIPGGSFRGRIIVSAGVCEENLTGAALGRVLERERVDVAVIAEPTGLRVATAQKGRADIVVTARGRSAHTSRPELGENAVYKMLEAVARLRAMQQPTDPELGRGVLELIEIVSEPFPGTAHVPDGCRSRWLMRTLPGETRETVLARLRGALAGLPGVAVDLETSRQAPYSGAAELIHDGYLAGWRTPDDDAWLPRLLSALASAGIRPATFAAPFGCNASACAARGIPAFIFGPGSLEQAHAVDEWIDVEELRQGERGYARIAGELLEP